MNVLICRDWRIACSITTVPGKPGAVLMCTEIRADVLSGEQGEPDAANRWSSRMMGGRRQDGYWQLSWDVVKEGIRNQERSVDFRVVGSLTFKSSVFSERNIKFIFGPEHTQELSLRLKMGWNWLQREWYTYLKHYFIDFCGVFSFPCPCCCFRWVVLPQQWTTWWQKPCPIIRLGLNLGHCNLKTERLEALPSFQYID